MSRLLRTHVLALAAALALLASQTVAQEERTPAAPISEDGALYLARSTLIALHQANQTGNYTVLRDLGAPGFQQANSAARLGEIFAPLRSQSLDLTVAAVASPSFTQPFQMTGEGMLYLVGEIDAGKNDAAFEMLFQPVGGAWHLFGLSVQPAAPASAAPAADIDQPTFSGEDAE